MDGHALRAQLRRQFVQEGLEAAGVGAQLERALDDARPHEGHRHLVVLSGEFADQQRLEKFLIGLGAHPAAHPGSRR